MRQQSQNFLCTKITWYTVAWAISEDSWTSVLLRLILLIIGLWYISEGRKLAKQTVGHTLLPDLPPEDEWVKDKLDAKRKATTDVSDVQPVRKKKKKKHVKLKE